MFVVCVRVCVVYVCGVCEDMFVVCVRVFVMCVRACEMCGCVCVCGVRVCVGVCVWCVHIPVRQELGAYFSPIFIIV